MKQDKLSKTEKGVIAIIIVTMLASVVLAFVLAFGACTSDTNSAPKHGSYAKCDQYGVKGCVRWSVVTY